MREVREGFMKPTIGRIVHYRISERAVRPALIVEVFSEINGCSNLQVFVDGANDLGPFTMGECERGLAWRTSVVQGDGIKQWQWPQREP